MIVSSDLAALIAELRNPEHEDPSGNLLERAADALEAARADNAALEEQRDIAQAQAVQWAKDAALLQERLDEARAENATLAISVSRARAVLAGTLVDRAILARMLLKGEVDAH